MKAWLFFLLGFFLVFAPAFAFCGTVTELWKEKYSGIYIAYVEDGKIKPFQGCESILLGYMPRNIIVEPIHVSSDSEFLKNIQAKIYEM